MTVDEELTILEETIRRLKIEYDVFFGGGSKRPPNDTEWRAQSLIKKYSDSQKMNFAQRFRYNSIVQRYAIFSDLWRQKCKIKEEGYRRPQDALLAIQGLRTEEEKAAAQSLSGEGEETKEKPFSVACSDVDSDHEHVQRLFNAMVDARTKAGDAGAGSANFDSFKAFVKKKTDQIRKDYGCHAVEYTVEMDGGQVRLKAKAKV
ncbi:MAG: MXAN_5187 C-terminal domain-containing protein [Terriglobales bacterium]